MKICPECGKREIGDRATMCHTCQMRERRAYFRKKGICPECGKNELFGVEKTCIECRAANAETKMKRYYSNHEESRKKANESRRRFIERRKEAGQCVNCGRATKGNHTHCDICLARWRNKRHTEILRSERPLYGLCYICGKPLDRDGRSCTRCAERCTETIAKYRSVKSKTWSAERKKDDSR